MATGAVAARAAPDEEHDAHQHNQHDGDDGDDGEHLYPPWSTGSPVWIGRPGSVVTGVPGGRRISHVDDFTRQSVYRQIIALWVEAHRILR